MMSVYEFHLRCVIQVRSSAITVLGNGVVQWLDVDVVNGCFDIVTHIASDMLVNEPRRGPVCFNVNGFLFVRGPRSVSSPSGDPIAEPLHDDMFRRDLSSGHEIVCDIRDVSDEGGERFDGPPDRFVRVDRVKRF